jgi:hypothetical protein
MKDTQSFYYLLFFFLYLYFNPKIIVFLTILTNKIDGILKYNKIDLIEKTDESLKEENEEKESKYEDKYLKEIRELNKEFKFSEEEEDLRVEQAESYFNQTIEEYKKKIIKIKNEILALEVKKEYFINLSEDLSEEEEYCITKDSDSNSKYEYDEYYDYETKDEIIENINGKIILAEKEKQILTEIIEKIESTEGQVELIKKSDEIALDFIINKHLERLQNCYVFENTPHGNVLMIYDHSRTTFKYYSDNSIPYRYLEPVARKYVKQFDCRPIFVDMEYELKLAEEKWERERLEKEEKENNSVQIDNKEQKKEKKSVFAKFKSYNKDAISGKVNMGAPPKNSIPNNKLTKEQENEKILLKEKANRYTYEGKFVNFSFLKKIDRKVTDKKYGLTFADFKKLNKN